MNFINTGLDERILKSLNSETPSGDLIKAMNKQGLVQRDVQVKGKNGTFTRKQWVKAGDDQNSASTSASASTVPNSADTTHSVSLDSQRKLKAGSILCRKREKGGYYVYQKQSSTVGASWSVQVVTDSGKVSTLSGKEENKMPTDGFVSAPQIVKNHITEIHNPFLKESPSFVEHKSSSQSSSKKTSDSPKKTMTKHSYSVGDDVILELSGRSISAKVVKIGNNAMGDTVYTVKETKSGSSSAKTYTVPADKLKVVVSSKSSHQDSTKNSNSSLPDTITSDSGNLKFTLDSDGSYYSDALSYDMVVTVHDSKGNPSGVKGTKSPRFQITPADTPKGKRFRVYENHLGGRHFNKSFKTLKEAVKYADSIHSSSPGFVSSSSSSQKSDDSPKSFRSSASVPDLENGVRSINRKLKSEFGVVNSVSATGGGGLGKQIMYVSPSKLNSVTNGNFNKLNSLIHEFVKKEFGKDIIVGHSGDDKNGYRFILEVSDSNQSNQNSTNSSNNSMFALPSGKTPKQAVTDLIGSHSRSDIMTAAKSAGITWKESDHEGINWMRASMAIQKYMSKN